jgi:hypothetical protein
MSEKIEHFTLVDWDHELAQTNRWRELEKLMRNLTLHVSRPNSICTLVSPSGQRLSIGIAEPGNEDNPDLEEVLCCLNHQLPSGDPPYRTVVNPSYTDSNGDEVVVFRFEDGEWTEVPRKNCVKIETMIDVVKHFFESDSLPTWITWEEV